MSGQNSREDGAALLLCEGAGGSQGTLGVEVGSWYCLVERASGQWARASGVWKGPELGETGEPPPELLTQRQR